MATVVGPGLVTLSAAQTGNGASTNILEDADLLNPALVTIVTTIGATPTVLIDLQGSVDGVDWWNVAYATTAAPETPVVSQVGPITTATTTRLILRPTAPWRYFRLLYSANTNVTSTATVFTF